MITRRRFVTGAAACGISAFGWKDLSVPATAAESSDANAVSLPSARLNEDVFAYVQRVANKFDGSLYRQILGSANPFKEGDASLGVAAQTDTARQTARQLLGQTRVGDLDSHPVYTDHLATILKQSIPSDARFATQQLTLGELKAMLLEKSEDEIKEFMPGLSSDVIGCIVKLMSNEELMAVGSKIFNPLPGSQIGAQGYLGARIQPNSPTDNLDDIRWQVFDGWSYAVGDVVLGTNPVSSDPKSVEAIELALQDLLVTFDLQDALPHCVLSHIDVQAEVENTSPGSTALWFQSIAGTDGANQTFDISVEKMLDYALQRTGRFDLYFETGQGADFTNGHGNGFDMVLHESRKYGFARFLKTKVAQVKAGSGLEPWVHLNDVAGFIGPEVFRTKEQLVRCCLEDIVMGKLHGLAIGLDVCSTLHMEVSLDDLDWCLDQVMPANPAYLMALPTKIDPMLGYLTTGFQDHVRLREKFGFRVNDRIWKFFQELGVIDSQGKPTANFGDPVWVYIQYQRRKGDRRPESELRAEGNEQVQAVRNRGVFLAEGYGNNYGDLSPKLAESIGTIYDDAKKSIWAEFRPSFVDGIPNRIALKTQSRDRNDYILHPPTGENLSTESILTVEQLRKNHAGKYDVQIVVSDGLNALSIMEPAQLQPFLDKLHDQLRENGYRAAPEHLVVNSGRVRAGYQIGEILFNQLRDPRAILHIIGERPGTGHRTFSIYMTGPDGKVWGIPGKVDHNITKVVSGVATTALAPRLAAVETVRLLTTITARP